MYNPYLMVPLLVWAITQFLKFILAAFQGRLDFRYLYASGGMPSVHSAVVTSLATTAFLVDGPQSPMFGLTVILAAIVMYDSFGVRRSSGEQAIAINTILDSLKQDKVSLLHPQHHLREMLGHKPLEVAIGAGLGLFLGGLFNINRLDTFFEVATTPVALMITYVVAGLSVLVLAGSLIGRWWYGRRYPVATVQELARRLSWVGVSYAVIGGALAFLQYEKVVTALWMVWPILLVGLLIATLAAVAWPFRRRIPEALTAYREQADKQRWLEGPNKKKRAAKARAKKRR